MSHFGNFRNLEAMTLGTSTRGQGNSRPAGRGLELLLTTLGRVIPTATASCGHQTKMSGLCGLGQLGAQGLWTFGPIALSIYKHLLHLAQPWGGLKRPLQPPQAQIPTVIMEPH